MAGYGAVTRCWGSGGGAGAVQELLGGGCCGSDRSAGGVMEVLEE